MIRRPLVLGAILVVLAAAAGIYRFNRRSADSPATSPSTGGEASALSAVARLQPIDSKVSGTVRFTPSGDHGGVAVRYNLRNVPPGEHALHVHENGDCTATDGSSVGALLGAGDLGNLRVNETRFARGDQVHSGLSGVAALSGRAVVLHERAGPAEADAGRPIACGVVEER